MTFRPILAVAAALLAAWTVGGATAHAADQKVTTRYGMSIIGLPVGQAIFDTVIDEGSFSVSGTLSSAGIGSLVSDTRGTSRVAGKVTRRGFSAESYGLEYTSDRKRWSSDVAFNGGRVVSSKVGPKRASDKPGFIPVQRSQLRSVVDPLSGLMIKTGDPASVCRRTLPLYDGWSRLDLKLSPAGTRRYDMRGFSGEAVVCKLRIAPVSGFDASSKGLKFLKDQTVELWFAPIARKDVYVPVYARIPTKVGPLTLSAMSVSVD
ncbi:DUF3108 domain-containing protein [Aurantimonas sp. A2-1-M11]|uniref:DUF3108 domain-containing protein n=1 Tax=Aurantimonas sp. A2-1-M11 TaxID=3113712 RepID=UPI002F9356B4